MERLEHDGYAINGIEGYGFSQFHWLVQFQLVIYAAILITYLARMEKQLQSTERLDLLVRARLELSFNDI